MWRSKRVAIFCGKIISMALLLSQPSVFGPSTRRAYLYGLSSNWRLSSEAGTAQRRAWWRRYPQLRRRTTFRPRGSRIKVPTALARAMLGKTTLLHHSRTQHQNDKSARISQAWRYLGERLGGGEGGSECQCLSGVGGGPESAGIESIVVANGLAESACEKHVFERLGKRNTTSHLHLHHVDTTFIIGR